MRVEILGKCRTTENSCLGLGGVDTSEFSVRVLAEASRSAFKVAQEDIAFIPSSSACEGKVGLVLFC